MLEHGGRLLAAARRHGIPPRHWLDLSTGIAPWPYPLPAPPAAVWQRLPEEEDGLTETAHAYYGAAALPVPGSQWAIEAIPRLLPPGRVAMPQPIYGEHPAAWQAAGHRLVGWGKPADYAVVCNPNNPTGERFSRAELLALAARVRFLLVDEAFIDEEPDESLVGCEADHVVVLRSLGKFFGLAGLRLGFVLGAAVWRQRLQGRLSPWAVSHPARWAACLALADVSWHAQQRQRLRDAATRLAALLAPLGEASGCAFFRYVRTPRADALYTALAQHGILVRRLAKPAALRFGLPAAAGDWQRLATFLRSLA